MIQPLSWLLLSPLFVNRTRTVALQLMKESFPYHTRDVYSHETFTRNLLMVVHYIPDLRLQILELLVEKMLQLDVRYCTLLFGFLSHFWWNWLTLIGFQLFFWKLQFFLLLLLLYYVAKVIWNCDPSQIFYFFILMYCFRIYG